MGCSPGVQAVDEQVTGQETLTTPIPPVLLQDSNFSARPKQMNNGKETNAKEFSGWGRGSVGMRVMSM